MLFRIGKARKFRTRRPISSMILCKRLAMFKASVVLRPVALRYGWGRQVRTIRLLYLQIRSHIVPGWPTAGTTYQAAVPSMHNAATFWSSGVCGMLNWGVNVFYFEAFDEPWKPVSVGDDGSIADETHWGSFDADRRAKFEMACGSFP